MTRAEDNQAIEDLDELLLTIQAFADEARVVLIRNRFTPGIKRRRKGEFGDMEGSGETHYNDPTGEAAIYDEEIPDDTGKKIQLLALKILEARSLAKQVLALSSRVSTPIHKERPICFACGERIKGKVLAGLDESCYRRWVRRGRPDRVKFINESRAERQKEALDAIDSQENAVSEE